MTDATFVTEHPAFVALRDVKGSTQYAVEFRVDGERFWIYRETVGAVMREVAKFFRALDAADSVAVSGLTIFLGRGKELDRYQVR